LFRLKDYLIDFMPEPFRALTKEAFIEEVEHFPWMRRIWRVDMHHTWYPAHQDYCGLETIKAMRRFHVHERNFDDIAQHVSIAPDGCLWTGRDWNKTPASVGGVLNNGAFMFETIGNFDEGNDCLQGQQLESVILVISTVQRRFRLPVNALLFHRDVPVTDKTCPGTSVDKLEILRHVQKFKSADLAPLTS
jgi:hypothetical protein